MLTLCTAGTQSSAMRLTAGPLLVWLMLQAEQKQAAISHGAGKAATWRPSMRNFKAAAGAYGGCAIRPSENLRKHMSPG